MPNQAAADGPRPRSSVVYWITFAAILVVAFAVRFMDTASWRKTGFDELIYRRYLALMDGGTQKVAIFQKDMTMKLFEYDVEGTGAGAVPSSTRLFLRTQAVPGTECELPPTRFLYIYTSWLWKNLRYRGTPALPLEEIGREWQNPPTGPDRSHDVDRLDPALRALHDVAFGFGLLLVGTAGLFGSRMLGRGLGLAVMALVAFDPVLIHLTQHAMVDGSFAFWALLCLWMLWENLQRPNHLGWLTALGASLALMVITKENAFFVYCALGALIIVNRWAQFGKVTARLLATMFVGPAIGVVLLVIVAGGVDQFLAVYQTLVAKAQNLAYAQQTGDGPWYRYLLDLLTVSPIIFCLAVGSLFAPVPQRKWLLFLAAFVAASYLIMCNVRYGMNLRYASIWSMPIRSAVVLVLASLTARFGRSQWIALAIGVTALCAYDFRQYWILATNPQTPLYELIPADLLRLLNVIKPQ